MPSPPGHSPRHPRLARLAARPGPQLPKKIRALASYRDFTFAATGNEIAIFKRAHKVATWIKHNEKVNMLLLFGDHILSLDIRGNLYIWAFKDLENSVAPVGHIQLEQNFSPSCIMHPDTYLNKVVIGSSEGSLQLWNISSQKKIYDFKGRNSAVHCCVSSSALDVVAVGCADGKVHIHNLRYDEEVVSFTHSTRGAVTALSFRTDGQPHLASGGSSGVISIWNLDKRRIHSVIKDAHDSSIVSLHFFANEPVLMSSSSDNSIKMWIFDTSDQEARLLRFRSGHSAPPLCIRFYGYGRHLLSAGQDRAFRFLSISQDHQSRELSQRHVSKRAKRLKLKEEEIKLKPVISFDFAEIRQRDWCNVVTCHMDTPQAYVWRLQNYVLGEHILKPSCPDNPTPVKSCAVSACGNFAVLGTQGGWIERFNLQSGERRGSYVENYEQRRWAHDGEVVSLACDATNCHLISAGYHGDIKVWDFKGLEVKHRWEVGCPVVKFVYHRSNGLLATVADDKVLRLYDVLAVRMVRKFEGHSDRITDLCFSEDGKWLLSSSMDGTLRVWDVIRAKQIDAIHVDVAITALSLSPRMDILATTHVDQIGIYTWVNQMLYCGSLNVDSFGSKSEVVKVQLPTVSSKQGSEDIDTVHEQKSEGTETSVPYSNSQIPDLVTLSLLPKAQWQSLINLDLIKIRNKPIEPPKKPEKAPFFLPSLPSLSGDVSFKPSSIDNSTSEKGTENDKGLSRPYSKWEHESSTLFVQLLHSCSETKTFHEFRDYIKNLSPSTLDMEIRMLQIIDDEDIQEPEQRPELLSIGLLLDYFILEVSHGSNFEFIQAVIRVFLKIHGETVRRHAMLQKKAQKLLEIQASVWQKIDTMFQSTRCMVTFLSNSQFF
ncbi:hypothetical protein AMTR_s00025p00209980 [Amborella trichopoda]|uniref:Uncharacterized protein n=1 Tax=Amborella trichopoda TaxID=13333 RepID=W1PX90_AMBTC|nr:hypothetical protein AMTR_s00025p00209980 [Amborella trichopoda]